MDIPPELILILFLLVVAYIVERKAKFISQMFILIWEGSKKEFTTSLGAVSIFMVLIVSAICFFHSSSDFLKDILAALRNIDNEKTSSLFFTVALPVGAFLVDAVTLGLFTKKSTFKKKIVQRKSINKAAKKTK
jgi:hypothetical protein